MDEYLFFQQHKSQLRNNSPVISPKIFPGKASNLDQRSTPMNLGIQKPKQDFVKRPESTMCLPSPQKLDKIMKIDQFGKEIFEMELNENTMQGCLKGITNSSYTKQYEISGYPPKICTLIMKELINQPNMLKVKVMDIGCGKGQIGQYLKEDGFKNIHGLDCSKNLLQTAQQKKVYQSLDKAVFGDCEVEERHVGKYDVLISASMINNDGWDSNVFEQMLKYVKIDGYIIFTTKLDKKGNDKYAEDISKLETEQHWKFVTQHTFYRYDKLCGNQGKFSNKQVKIVAYQKTDHNIYLTKEKNRIELQAQQEKTRFEEIEYMKRKKDDKLNRGQNEKAARKKHFDDQAQAERDAEKNEKIAKQAQEQEKALNAAKNKERKEMMMKKLKTFIENAMWVKLKAIKLREEERIQELQVEAEKKRQAVMFHRKQTILKMKAPYDSDSDEETAQVSGAFKPKTNLLDQKYPA